MARRDLWIIEARDEKGQLDFSVPQPSERFGEKAITGITEDAMAQVIFRSVPDAILDGRLISSWPRLLHPQWLARRKTW